MARSSMLEKSPSETCGCDGAPRRLCDVCEGHGRSFLASSLVCLERHLAVAHAGQALPSSSERARSHVAELNRLARDGLASDAAHREHVTELIGRLPRGEELCVLGAGNGKDLDLERLAAWFREVHLVDLDGQALEHARDRQSAEVRSKIVLHPEVDFSGMLDHLDDWGEAFPRRDELGKAAVAAVQDIASAVGRSFPATVSLCVLSQLAVPFQRAWITTRGNWGELLSTLSAVHLATLAGSTRAGGRGLLLFDVASSMTTPELTGLRGRSKEQLEAFVAQACEAGELYLRPEPRQLYMQLSSPGLRQLVSDPELGTPWLRYTGQDTQLVYSLEFAHPLTS